MRGIIFGVRCPKIQQYVWRAGVDSGMIGFVNLVVSAANIVVSTAFNSMIVVVIG
jgi:hypothetical protein